MTDVMEDVCGSPGGGIWSALEAAGATMTDVMEDVCGSPGGGTWSGLDWRDTELMDTTCQENRRRIIIRGKMTVQSSSVQVTSVVE